ncbi:MAG: hypothetical protein LQ352_001154 [Teloschistes flavicans]|nr:MAG: hypothetical protein LQ352_001154 [Teloschistes flavicans]
MAQGPSPPPPPPPPPSNSDKSQKTTDIIGTLRPTKLFKLSKPNTYVTSLDFDDEGQLLLAACSDDSLQLYSARDGTHQKLCLSQKYGCHLARFSHHSQSIYYASTKFDDNIRYLSTHDNNYIRYFKGHSAAVTDLAPCPSNDMLLSCSADNTVRLWNSKSQYAQARLNLATPYLATFDPTASVIAIASASTSSILLYDLRNYEQEPFATFDMREYDPPSSNLPEWTKLEFSNDGKSLLVSTNHGQGHLLLDAFTGMLKAHLPRPYQSTWGVLRPAPSAIPSKLPLGQGDTSFTADGRYVIGGSGADRDAVVWDTQGVVKQEGERKLEAPADLARTCRTCRVFHYMTLPQLYTNVALRSYDSIRYSQEDGRPEGCGMGSPFVMGLNGLVLRNVAGYVKRLKFVGECKEYDSEECYRKGRVPDSTMMLNTLVTVAIERCTALRELWYIALSSLYDVSNIDPTYYGDDISHLLARSRNLRELSLIWSPRMREAGEPSIHLGSLFGKVEQPLTLTKVAVKNLYHHDEGWCARYYDPSNIEEITFINSSESHDDKTASAFIDFKLCHTIISLPRLKLIRGDRASRQSVEVLAKTKGLEKIYLIGPRTKDKTENDCTVPQSPISNGSSPPGSLSSNVLRDEHIETITQNHGQTLRHLLLPPQWRLTSENIALIVRNCPNLEQLAFGADFDKFSNLRLLVPFLPKIFALRLLDNPDNSEFRDKMHELDDGKHEKIIGSSTSAREWSKIRWMELADLLFEIGKVEPTEDPDSPGKMSYRRSVRKRDREAVKDVDIWRMDSLDI